MTKRRYYLAAHRRVVNVLTSNSAFLMFAVFVVWFSHSYRASVWLLLLNTPFWCLLFLLCDSATATVRVCDYYYWIHTVTSFRVQHKYDYLKMHLTKRHGIWGMGKVYIWPASLAIYILWYGYGRFWGSVGMGILRPVGMVWNPIPTATLAMVIVFDSRRKWRCNLGQSTRDVTKAIVTQNVHKWHCCGRVTTTYCYWHRNYCHKNCWHHQVMSVHWRRQGGQGAQALPTSGQKNFLLKKTDFQVSRDLVSNMYTCIAYLIEIRKFCSKNLVHKGVNFEAQNAL